MTTPLQLPLADDYTVERARFLNAAETAHAVVEHHRHPLAGPDGGPVLTDVARLGAPIGEARSVLVVNSGLHGVEGHAGSGLQTLLIERGYVDTIDPGTAVVFIHAANPFGMAWDRRVDHQNVDVNRNFVDFSKPLPANPGYEDLRPFLNPSELDIDDQSWMLEVLAHGERVGMGELFSALSGGQYIHPHGLQFGGTAETWTRTVLEDVWRRHADGAQTLVHLDVHTGLGPCGALTTFQTADADEAAAEAAQTWFENVFRSDRTTDNPITHGVLGPGMDAVLSTVPLVVPVVLEWGTYDEATVAGAMRADNWLHHYGDPQGDLGQEIRRRTRAAFAIDEPDWRTTLAAEGVDSFERALSAVSTQ